MMAAPAEVKRNTDLQKNSISDSFDLFWYWVNIVIFYSLSSFFKKKKKILASLRPMTSIFAYWHLNRKRGTTNNLSYICPLASLLFLSLANWITLIL